MTRLLIGSEGTLGIVTEATLKLHGIPKVSRSVYTSISMYINQPTELLTCLSFLMSARLAQWASEQQTHTHTHTHMYSYIHAQTHKYSHIDREAHIRTRAHSHTNTHIHTETHAVAYKES